MRNFLIPCFLFLISHSLFAQYPRDYFRNPLGIPMQLAANFGEVRTDHFHMGFDLRTNQRENLSVYAAAEGYISRVIIEQGGYGRAIYITHPKGYTTLYAHLNDFYPALHQYVKDKQYKDEQWEQDIRFTKDQFPVSKGQFIARSGNTGASQGPHLHFEIRDTKTGNNINPRLFDFPIRDNLKPYIYKLFVYDRNHSTYSIAPTEVKIKGGKGNYDSRDDLIEIGSGKISFGISAEDIGNTSPFRYGIYAAELWMDSVKQFSFELDELNYNDSKYMNASIDYRKKLTDGSVVQHLSKLPGNQLSIFDGIHDGVIHLTDTLPHIFVIKVKDVNDNESALSFTAVWKPELYEQRFFSQETVKMHPNKRNQLARESIQVDFPAAAFYDTVAFFHSQNGDDDNFSTHQLHYHFVPVHETYLVTLTPNNKIDTTKLVWKLTSGNRNYTSKAIFNNGKITGAFEKLGALQLENDTIPPTISFIGWKENLVLAKNGSINISAKDDNGYVADFRAELDGKWLMFSRKGNTFTYKFDEYCALGKHELKVIVKDVAGNETIRTFNFELKEKLPVKKKKSVKKRPRRKK